MLNFLLVGSIYRKVEKREKGDVEAFLSELRQICWSRTSFLLTLQRNKETVWQQGKEMEEDGNDVKNKLLWKAKKLCEKKNEISNKFVSFFASSFHEYEGDWLKKLRIREKLRKW